MGRKKHLNFRFLKVNYLNSIFYYGHNKSPKKIFHDYIIRFFKKSETDGEIFNFRGVGYRFGGLDITRDYAFGKLWKLKKKPDKNFPWTGKDYIIKEQISDDFLFSYFLFYFKTNHLIVQDEIGHSAEGIKNVFQVWFDNFYKTKDAINLQYLKNKKDFIKQLRDAYQIKRAKFTVFPSNFDFDHLSKPLDEEMKRLGISRLDQDVRGNTTIKLDLEKPNAFVSPLVQALRGNGEPPEVKIGDKNGNERQVSSKKKEIRRTIEDSRDLDDIKKKIIQQLESVLEELKKV